MRRPAELLIVAAVIVSLASSAHAQVVAGVDPVGNTGVVDGWTNILYINEQTPFDFGPAGNDHGVLTMFNFWVNAGRSDSGMVTPFVAEPLDADPLTGDDYVIRAIGTTREAGTHWDSGGLYGYPFHDTQTYVVQDGWVAGFLSSDPLGESVDARSPIPFVANAGIEGWLTGSDTAGSGFPNIVIGDPIEEGNSGTQDDAYGLRQYQFQIEAVAGDLKPNLPPGGKIADDPILDVPGNIGGVEPIAGDGEVDSWTNILYINEQTPFDFSEFGSDKGTLSEFNFWVSAARVDTGMVTPFVAEPLVDDPQIGEDYIIRAIGTTRQAGTDWDTEGAQSFPFHDAEQPEVQDGWVAGFVTSDPEGFSIDAASPIPFIGGAGVEGWLTGTSAAGTGLPAIALGEPIEEGTSGTQADAYGQRHYQFQIVAQPGAGGTRLQAGDADQNLQFDQLDLVTVQIAAKYLTGQAATWGEGDWDGAPGGAVGSPPPGDGVFNQLDIIAALNANIYLKGPYAAIKPGGAETDQQTSLVYDANTGEVSVDAPANTQLTSINIESAAAIFTGEAAQNLGGSFDNDSDNNIFKATFGDSFGSLDFGPVAQAGLSEDFLLTDLTVVGSLAGGGDLGDVDLIYVPAVPEPATLVLSSLGLVGLLACARARRWATGE